MKKLKQLVYTLDIPAITKQNNPLKGKSGSAGSSVPAMTYEL